MKKPALITLALLATVCAAQGIDTPPMKEGLWKFHMVTSSPGSAPSDVTYSLCRNHASDQQAHDLATKQPGCVVTQDSSSGNKRTYTGTCKVAGTTITSKSTLTISGDTSFHSETATTYCPAFYGKTHDTMVQDQTYIGSCPAGMNPGDTMATNGQIRHRSMSH